MWRKSLFAIARNATSAVDRFGLPTEGTVGPQVALRFTLSKRMGGTGPPRADGSID